MALPSPTTSSLRQRRGGMKEVVQELDAFVKIADDAIEEPKASKGILSILSFALIAVLSVQQIYHYFYTTEVRYRFSVDVELDEMPIMDLDLIVATPCNNLAIMPMGMDTVDVLQKNPSRFEMTSREQKLWDRLRHVHRENFKPGTPLRQINKMTYISGDVESGLEKVAEEKQRMEFEELERKKNDAKEKGEDEEDHGMSGHFFMAMVGNGMGVFQIITSNLDEKDEGTACRVNGKVPIQKGSGGRLAISVGRNLPMGVNILQHLGSHNHGNISHRIERLHFGEHVWGLVTPLAGTEQVAQKAGTEYKYFLKIVPTRIYEGIGFGAPLSTFQYAVTYVKHESKNEEEHVHDSIVFDYEFVATVVEVHSASMSLLQFMLRLCSVTGGIFATSKFLEIYLSRLFTLFVQLFLTRRKLAVHPVAGAPKENDGQPLLGNGKQGKTNGIHKQ